MKSRYSVFFYTIPAILHLKTTYFEVKNDKKKILPLVRYVSRLRNPRKDKGKRHPLKSILALVVIGLMCGHKGWTSIATWARSQPALAKAPGFTKKKTPAASTIHNLLKKLNVVALEETLTQWVNTVIESRPDLTGCLDAVATDGKTMRAS